ncbi:MAG: hypothetical protein WC043_02320 [Pseudobdellovibrionaceae bacterium]
MSDFEDRVTRGASRQVGRSLGRGAGDLIEGGFNKLGDALGLESDKERRDRMRHEQRMERMEQMQAMREARYGARYGGYAREAPQTHRDVGVRMVRQERGPESGSAAQPLPVATPAATPAAVPVTPAASGNPLQNALEVKASGAESNLTKGLSPEQQKLFDQYKAADKALAESRYGADGKVKTSMTPEELQKMQGATQQREAIDKMMRENMTPEQQKLLDKYQTARQNADNWGEYKGPAATPVATPAPATAPAVPAAPVADNRVVDLAAQQKQAYLRVLGYDTGKLDGDQGPKTNGALDKFAKDKGIDPRDTNAVNRALQDAAQDPKVKSAFVGRVQEQIALGKASPDDIKALQWQIVGGKDPEGTMPKSFNEKTKMMDGVAGSETKESLKSTFARTAEADPETTARVAALQADKATPQTVALQTATPAVDATKPAAANRDNFALQA